MDAAKVARTVTFVLSTLLAITDKKTPASVACSPVNVVLDQAREGPLHISQILLITFLGRGTVRDPREHRFGVASPSGLYRAL